MSDLITALYSLFEFLFDQLTYVANFFVSTVIGQIILGISLFYIGFHILTIFLSLFKK